MVSTYQGIDLEMDAARYAKQEASTAIPFSGGQIRLEYNASLQPYRARGCSADVGEYYKLSSSMPMVRDAIASPVSAISAAPWRLEKASLPAYYKGNEAAQAALERQHQYCSYVWSKWTSTGADTTWADWINDILQFSLISGFYLGELLGTEQTVSIDGAAQSLVCPQVPMTIAPWSVDQWLFKDNPTPPNMIGIVQRTYDQMDSYGNAGPGSIVLPWHKLIHSAYMPTSQGDLEGRSILRPAYQPLRMKQKILQISALGCEVGALGLLVCNQDATMPMSEEALETLRTNLDQWTAEACNYILLPPGDHKISILTPNQTVPDLTAQLQMLDNVIGKALGNSHKLMGVGGAHGSFAARSDASSEARYTYDHLAQYCSRIAERVLHQFVEFNFPIDAAEGYLFVPGVEHAVLVQPDKQSRAATLSTLVQAGLIEATPEIRAQMLRENNLAASDPPVESS